MTFSITKMPLCWVSLCWVSLCWVSLCWVSLCWVSLCWVSLCWVSLCWVSRFFYCYAECYYAQCHYAEHCCAECRYAECRGALTSPWNVRLGRKNVKMTNTVNYKSGKIYLTNRGRIADVFEHRIFSGHVDFQDNDTLPKCHKWHST